MEWPFALLHITQSIELILKQLLKNIHPIFIYEDIDHPKRTVSLEQALARLDRLGVDVAEKERLNIRRATECRNLVVHYEFELNRHHWKRIYSQLFEFVHFLHHKHLKSEIHTRISKDNWAVEAHLMTYFRSKVVNYNGIEMINYHPKELLEAQNIRHFSKNGKKYERLRYGAEPRILELNPSFAETPCHDCGALRTQYHVVGCDVEECPKCHGQAMCCDCGW